MVIRAALGDVLGNPIPANTKMRIRIFIFAASPIPVPIRQYGSQHFIATAQLQAVNSNKVIWDKNIFYHPWVLCEVLQS